MSSPIARLLSPEIFPLVDEILQKGNMGICAGNMRVIDIKTGLSSFERKDQCGDRFKLLIPYAGHSVTWEVVFFGGDAEFPPDFLFDDKSFEPELENIQSLTNWSKDDTTSLFHIIKELMDVYRKHQVSLIEEYSRLQFEYSSLVQLAEFTEEDIEARPNGNVNFLIRLPVDFSLIPPVLITDCCNDDSAILLVTFSSHEGNKVTSQLFLSPIIQEALGGTSSLRIPSFPTGGCLMDYVPSVLRFLKLKVDQIVTGFGKRKEFFDALLQLHERTILEYDTDTFSQISFLFERQQFYFILHIKVPQFFPQDKPVLVFHSVYHFSNSKVITSNCHDYPYSPRWSGMELAERTSNFVLEYAPIFQKNSTRSGLR